MGKGQSCHGDPQSVHHHRSRGLKMCLCDSKHTLCTDTQTGETRKKKEKGLEKEVGKNLQRGQHWAGEQSTERQREECELASQSSNQEGDIYLGACPINLSLWQAAGKRTDSSGNDMAKQKPEPGISLSLAERCGREGGNNSLRRGLEHTEINLSELRTWPCSGSPQPAETSESTEICWLCY